MAGNKEKEGILGCSAGCHKVGDNSKTWSALDSCESVGVSLDCSNWKSTGAFAKDKRNGSVKKLPDLAPTDNISWYCVFAPKASHSMLYFYFFSPKGYPIFAADCGPKWLILSK